MWLYNSAKGKRRKKEGQRKRTEVVPLLPRASEVIIGRLMQRVRRHMGGSEKWGRWYDQGCVEMLVNNAMQ
jgi:hypothetical protein